MINFVTKFDNKSSNLGFFVPEEQLTLKSFKADQNIKDKVNKLLKIIDYTGTDYVERNLILIKVSALPGKRNEIIELVDVFRGKIIDVGQKDMIVEISGPEDRLEAVLNLLRPYGIKEVARTGRIAMNRGPK